MRSLCRSILACADRQTNPHPQTRRFGQRVFSSARALLPLLALAALAVSTRSLAQVPTFNTVIMTPTGSEPWNPPRPAAVGDFNGDGKLDALIVDGSSRARFMRGNGDGTFAKIDIDAALMTTGNMVGLPAHLAQYMPKSIDGYVLNKAADVNGDGKLDAICVTTVHINYGPYSLVTVLINTGNDAYGAPQFSTTNYFLGFYDVRSLTVGDLSGDGKPDIIVGSAYGGLYIYRNNGDGTFTLSQVTTIMPNIGGAVGIGVIVDVNGDGKADFVVTSGQANATDVFLGNGDGTLQSASVVSPAASCIAVADLNKDGKPDLLEGLVDGSVAVFPGNGNGTFGSPVSFPSGAGSWPNAFFVSDVNGDGNLDVAVGLASLAKVVILTGDGAGALSAPTLFGSIPSPVDVTLADFTGDGKPEIASVSAAGYGGQNFGVFANTTVFAPPLPTQTLTILGGVGNPGDIAANTEYYNSATGNWQPAYLADYAPYGHPVTHPWGNIAGTTRWINYKTDGASDPGASENNPLLYLYRVRFTVPADAQNATMTFSLKADNMAQVAINGVSTGSLIVGQADQLNADAVFSQNVHAGENTITINVGDQGGLNGFNFRIDLSVQSTQPLEIVPAAPADTAPPVITAPANIVAEATGPSGAVVNFTATAQDNVDGPVNVLASQPSGSTFALGTTTVSLSASDAAGNTATVSFTITVQDTIAPALTVPANQVLEATSAAGASATFAATATDAVGVTSITYSAPSGSTFPIGTTAVTVTAKDAAGNSSSGWFTVTVLDTTAPVISSLTVSSATLWPPNHKMVPITLSASASDAVGVSSLKIISATSNEPDNGLGDGDTAGDIAVTGALTLNLRAERSGAGNGRVYTITVEAKDAAGNASTRTVTVSVPKSQGGR